MVEHGIQLQLLAYLGALKNFSSGALSGPLSSPKEERAGERRPTSDCSKPLTLTLSPLGRGEGTNSAGAVKLVPAGAFYVSLRGKFAGGVSREEVLADTESSRLAYRHNGRFNADWLKQFDRRTEVASGDQFNYRLKKDGSLYANSAEALPGGEFAKLLDLVESQLRRLGDEIFSGRAAVDPYRKGKDTPCELCDYRAACRLDEWTHEFRELRPVSKAEAASE
jgi:ATP-dependent helicase/DNAse subunit B